MRRLLLVVFATLVAMIPMSALAAAPDGASSEGLVVRVNGDYYLPPGDSVNNVVIIHGNAVIDGTIGDRLLVIDGDAMVNGAVNGRSDIVRGSLTLAAGSRLQDIHLFRSDLIEQPGAVRGAVDRPSFFWLQAFGFVALVLVTIGMGVTLVAGGAVFSAIGGRQLNEAARLMTARPGRTIATAGIVAVGLPIVVVGASLTIIGLPLALAMALLVGPALVSLGFIVAGAWLGTLVLRRGGEARPHPYGETVLGLVILLAAFLVPGIGAPAFMLLGLWGTGALAYLAWRGVRPDRPRAVAPAAPATTPPASGMQPT